MKKAMDWLKKYGWMVLVGIAGILATILGVKYERKKIEALKRETTLAKVKSDISVAEYQKEAAKKADKILLEKENVLDETIKEDEDEIIEVRKKAEKTTGSDIADEFNRRYIGSK